MSQQSAAVTAAETVVPLLTKKDVEMGTVTAWNNASTLFIKIDSREGWVVSKWSMALATSLDQIPQNKKGKPKPNKFPYQMEYNPPVTSDTYSIPLQWPAGTVLYVALKANVSLVKNDTTAKNKKTWASQSPFPGSNWAEYFNDTVEKMGIIIITR
jgi:hypothetical protein